MTQRKTGHATLPTVTYLLRLNCGRNSRAASGSGEVLRPYLGRLRR